MNRETLIHLSKVANTLGPMVAAYPDAEDETVTFPPSPYYRFLNLLATAIPAKLCVELGVCGGGGSLHMAMSGSQVVGVDIALDYQHNIRYIKRSYPNFHFLHGDSVQVAPLIDNRFGGIDLHNRFGVIDLLFIDTTHTYEQTMAEYYAYEPYLSKEAVVCFDDLFREGMDKVWAQMPENKIRFDFLHPSASPTDGGFGVVWK